MNCIRDNFDSFGLGLRWKSESVRRAILYIYKFKLLYIYI